MGVAIHIQCCLVKKDFCAGTGQGSVAFEGLKKTTDRSEVNNITIGKTGILGSIRDYKETHLFWRVTTDCDRAGSRFHICPNNRAELACIKVSVRILDVIAITVIVTCDTDINIGGRETVIHLDVV